MAGSPSEEIAAIRRRLRALELAMEQILKERAPALATAPAKPSAKVTAIVEGKPNAPK